MSSTPCCLFRGSREARELNRYQNDEYRASRCRTVREDYSSNGSAGAHLPYDQARSRAYCWGEDGIAGFSDATQRLCLGLAVWNTRDPILKERLFGLTNSEGNHGEDVKELYYYLDATPSHSYLRMLYKYLQQEFPYSRLIEENRQRALDQPQFELIDSGVFDDTAISTFSSSTRRPSRTTF